MNTKGLDLDHTIEPTRRPGKNYLFAIAIDQYQHSPRLFNCIRDVERITALLHHDYQFEPENTFTLYNAEATEKNIFDTFKKLVRTVKPEDNLLILYSGHGEYEADIEEGYWIPVDAQLGDFSDYVSNGRIIKYLKAIEAHHILLIVDSCFSGTLFAHRNADNGKSSLRLDAIPSRWLLTAGRNEVVSDGKPGDHSPFADNVIYFLKQNQEDSLSVVDLSNAVTEGVIYNSRQTPRGEPLQDVGHRGGQFFFHRKGGYRAVPSRSTVDQSPKVQVLGKKGAAEASSATSTGGRVWLIGAIAVLIVIMAVSGLFLLRRPAEEGISSKQEAALEIGSDGASTAKEALEEPSIESASPPEKAAPGIPPKTTLSKAEQAWTAANNTDTEAAYRKFINRFPKSKWAAEAEQKIADLYRYSLLFNPVLKGGNQLEIHFSNGKAPYQIRLIKPNEEFLEKTWDSGGPFFIDLGTTSKKESGISVLTIIVTDYNFKKAGQKMPLF